MKPVFLALVSSCMSLPVMAADWGYDDLPAATVPLQAPPARKLETGKGLSPPPPAAEKAASKSRATGIAAAPPVHPAANVGAGPSAGRGAVGAARSAAAGAGSAGSRRPAGASASKSPAAGAGAQDNSARKTDPGDAEREAESGNASERVDKDRQAALCWLQVFQGISKAYMPFAQQKRIEAYLLAKCHAGEKPAREVHAILDFWPQVTSAIKDKPDLEQAYADLFRALLRIREKTQEPLSLPGSDIGSDSDLITEILGPERLAVPGDPPFAEDAVNAYADMACFVYEKTHPGKTVDATDNRALFARAVAQKFTSAPSKTDQQAMARFDLAWAKFRIIWEQANEAQRKDLLSQLVKSGAASSLKGRRDPVLDKVLGSWPWPGQH